MARGRRTKGFLFKSIAGGWALLVLAFVQFFRWVFLLIAPGTLGCRRFLSKNADKYVVALLPAVLLCGCQPALSTTPTEQASFKRAVTQDEAAYRRESDLIKKGEAREKKKRAAVAALQSALQQQAEKEKLRKATLKNRVAPPNMHPVSVPNERGDSDRDSARTH